MGAEDTRLRLDAYLGRIVASFKGDQLRLLKQMG